MSTSTIRWLPHSRYLRSTLPAGLADWLLDPASLTLRLQQLCPGGFSVRLIAQHWGYPDRHEALALGMRANRVALIRQVQLLCHQTPLVYARTVIPASSMRGRLRRLGRLGTRPLGGVLFADPGMRRGEVELARIAPHEAMYHAAMASHRKKSPVIWGRRSVFRLSGHPLLVSEVFLPAFPVADGPPARSGA